jgi:hypothetical protein
MYTSPAKMGPRDRDDLLRLVDRIQAIEQSDSGKALVCQELREKLQRYLANGWLPEPGARSHRAVDAPDYPQAGR